jgi:hypothetical protein
MHYELRDEFEVAGGPEHDRPITMLLDLDWRSISKSAPTIVGLHSVCQVLQLPYNGVVGDDRQSMAFIGDKRPH